MVEGTDGHCAHHQKPARAPSKESNFQAGTYLKKGNEENAE